MRTTLLCLALLALVSVTMVAQTVPGTITINGGTGTVSLNAPSKPATHGAAPRCSKTAFENTFSSTPYICNTGYTVSDGSPINTEYSPASEFKSKKSGLLSYITVAVGFVTGTNGAKVTLTKECGKEGSDKPCGIDGKGGLCTATIKNLPNFGSSCTVTETFKCPGKKKLTKGKDYYVYVESLDNSWLAWNLSDAANNAGGVIEGTNDVWGTESDPAQRAAFCVN